MICLSFISECLKVKIVSWQHANVNHRSSNTRRVTEQRLHLLSSGIPCHVCAKAIRTSHRLLLLTKDEYVRDTQANPFFEDRDAYDSQLWLQGSSHHYWTSRTVQGILGLLLLTIQGQTVSWAEGSPSSSHLLPYFPLHGIFPDVSLMFNPIFPDYSILASTSQTPGMTKIVPGATHRNRQRGEDLDWQTHHPC